MFSKYLVTGATGFLGRAVIAELREKSAEIYALVMEGDPLAGELPPDVYQICGDVCDESSLERFFSCADQQTCLIHCAGIVSVASHPGDRIYKVNAGGTNNILRHCERSNIEKLVYVSSVHAIPEKPKGKVITEDAVFAPERVRGDYAKSKAIATQLVFEAAKRGLNASVVFPSGIIGPGDIGKGSITGMLLSFLTGKLPFAVKGGYDFVDVRDVASGIAACAEYGLSGQGYILSGQYASIRDILEAAKSALSIKRTVSFLPICLARLAAPIYEIWSLRKHLPLYFTPYAIDVLSSNSRFSRKKAEAVLHYAPRSVKSSIRDTVLWLKDKM
ncbi:NAD-dependent epimerase/dehydratase family protein [Lachnoclostridium sp. Marseille-P6806]|uniref:NAD-dependent epimerase/dehydratase family protein n=1 Tax=Lachnoclostridium sp. Marseille-P6806 TaxID=2364793 RepID=UPI00103044CD|nr:NAD-dependent epimerase/dehydratase family protein [Lachnoclostridium sp. Marseille-P6806]